MITAPHIELLVAETDRELIASGYARIERAKPYLPHTRHAYLGFMYVAPEHRGRVREGASATRASSLFPLHQILIPNQRYSVLPNKSLDIRIGEQIGYALPVGSYVLVADVVNGL